MTEIEGRQAASWPLSGTASPCWNNNINLIGWVWRLNNLIDQPSPGVREEVGSWPPHVGWPLPHRAAVGQSLDPGSDSQLSELERNLEGAGSLESCMLRAHLCFLGWARRTSRTEAGLAPWRPPAPGLPKRTGPQGTCYILVTVSTPESCAYSCCPPLMVLTMDPWPLCVPWPWSDI